jgi:IS5 family transposase
MRTKSQRNTQGNFLYPNLMDRLDPNNRLLLLAERIDWDMLEDELSIFYSEIGRPAHPIRLMAGILILKQIENLSDEKVINDLQENIYYQAFCGVKTFSHKPLCSLAILTHFRNRIKEEGCELIFNESVRIHGKAALEKVAIIDTTVQEKNITFPTDSKLQHKMIHKFWRIAKDNGIKLRRSYKRELRDVLRVIRFEKSNKKKKEVNAARRRLRTIAGALCRELQRKLPDELKKGLQSMFDICEKILNQKKGDKNKIYSLHEPHVKCIAKGKVHKKYEFGSKVAFAITKNSAIIVGVKNFTENVHDSRTIETTLDQIVKATKRRVAKFLCDRGFRGKKKCGKTTIHIPEPPAKDASAYEKRKARKEFGRRSAVEPVIGHVKNDHRMARNFLKGKVGDAINALMSAAAFNFKKLMNTCVRAVKNKCPLPPITRVQLCRN